MNLFWHLSYIVVLDYLIFQYWYIFANRYTVLNYHESAFLPGRYIISGLVAGVFVFWLYLIPVLLLRTVSRRYRHPRWWLLWATVAVISSINVLLIVHQQSSPPLSLRVGVALVAHLVIIHSIMLMIAERAVYQGIGSVLPGVRSALILQGLWLFWIWYSFEVQPVGGSPHPIIGAVWERVILVICLFALMGVGIWYRWGQDTPWLKKTDWLLPDMNIRVSDMLDGFYSAWALFYFVVPVVQYLVRGYVMAHSNLFPAFLLGLLLPTIWSLLVMWGIIFISKPSLIQRLVGILWQRVRAWTMRILLERSEY